jgi:hypothetical protein
VELNQRRSSDSGIVAAINDIYARLRYMVSTVTSNVLNGSLTIPSGAGAGKVLTSDATGLAAWAANAALAQTSALLSATHTDTTAAACVAGDIIYGVGTPPKWTRMSAGAEGTVLLMGASLPSWSNVALAQFNGEIVINIADVSAVNIWAAITDVATGNLMYLSVSNPITNGAELVFPGSSGTVLTTNSTANVTGKALTGTNTISAASTNVINCNTTGPRFRNGTSTTQYMRLDLSLLTAARDKKFNDVSGTVVEKVGTDINLTAQTGSIGSTELVASTHLDGFYRLSWMVLCTTAGSPSDHLTLTFTYNNGGAADSHQVVTVSGLLDTLNKDDHGTYAFYSVTGTNIAFSTTKTGAGSPQYTLRIRTEFVG